MKNQQIVNFIAQCKTKGQTDAEIKAALMKAGWTEAALLEYFDAPQQPQETAPVTPQQGTTPSLEGYQVVSGPLDDSTGKWFIFSAIILGAILLGVGLFLLLTNISWKKTELEVVPIVVTSPSPVVIVPTPSPVQPSVAPVSPLDCIKNPEFELCKNKEAQKNQMRP